MNKFEYRRNDLDPSSNGLDLSQNGLVPSRNDLDSRRNGLDLTAKEADLSKNEAKEGHNGSNWRQIGVIEWVPDSWLAGFGFQAGAIGVVLGELIRKNILELAIEANAEIPEGI